MARSYLFCCSRKNNDPVVPNIFDSVFYDHATPYEELRNLKTGVNPNFPQINILRDRLNAQSVHADFCFKNDFKS